MADKTRYNSFPWKMFNFLKKLKYLFADLDF